MSNSPAFLLTDPAHFEVSYTINPWMTPSAWQQAAPRNREAARASFQSLVHALKETGAKTIVIDGAAGLPDMVFPANAGTVFNRRALVARFRHPERQGEEQHFMRAFDYLKRLDIIDEAVYLPEGCWQEGAGDCIWDASRQTFWTGYGPRSHFEAIAHIQDFFGMPVTALELITERFYHLDTCFLSLSGGEVLYYPPAFSRASLAAIRDRVPADLLIEASSEDASRFSVNAVNIGRTIIMARPPARLEAELSERGYEVKSVNLDPFIMAGGGAYCMTLRLDLKNDSASNKLAARETAKVS
jgi:N-dimethylarginine dimethylaminohydrolase